MATQLTVLAITVVLIVAIVAARRYQRHHGATGALREDLRALMAEAKQSGWSLRKSEESFRLLVEGVRDYAICMLDPAGRIASWNEGARRITGYTGEHIVGQPFSRFFTEEDNTRAKPDALCAIASVENRAEDEGWLVRKDGSRFRANVVLSTLRNESGRLRGYAMVIRDITARREAEERLRQHGDRLAMLSRRLVEVQESERRHLARELHDDVGQALTAVKLELQAMHVMSASPQIQTALQESLRVVDATLQHVRNLSLDLRPSILDDLGLVAAVRWFVDRQTRRAALTAHVSADPDGIDLPPDAEIAAFRLVQEAVTNAIKHARARHIRVALSVKDQMLEIAIHDDGIGFDVDKARVRAVRGDSMGLLSMEERMQSIGGTLRIQSSPRGGTRVVARFHVREPAAAGGARE